MFAKSKGESIFLVEKYTIFLSQSWINPYSYHRYGNMASHVSLTFHVGESLLLACM